MKKVLIAVFVALLSFSVAFAQDVDDQGNPNDISANERANSCFSGGNMAGKCASEWAWTCGWYVMRWEANSQYVVPDTCRSLVFYATPAAPVAPVCISTNIGYMKFTGPLNTSPDADQYSDDACSDYLIELTIVEAADKTSAMATCTTILAARSLTAYSTGKVTSPDLPDNLWYCGYALP